jgi:O-antigen/teichoic acid export membrane protein
MAWSEGRVSLSLLLLASAAMASRHALDFAANVFRGLERFEFENLARVVQTCAFCVFVWLGVYQETGGVIAAFVAFFASNAIAAVLIWAVLIIKWNCTGFRLNRAVALDWWRESSPLGVGDVVRQLLLQLDTLILSAFRPAGVVGLFSIAARPLQPLQLVPRIIVSVTFPMMSRAAHIDRESLSRMFAQTTNLLWIASLPISILVSVCARPLILATAGPEFVDATVPLQMLIWATALIFINAQLRFVLTALDAERAYRRLIIWVLAAKVSMLLVLIPLFGIYGACLGNLLGEVVLCGGGLWMLRDMHVRGPGWLQLLRAVPAACAMAAVLIPLVHEEAGVVLLAFGGLVSMVVYGVVCLVCGAWPWSDVMRIWQIVRRPATYSAAVVPARVAAVTEAEAALN